MSILTIYHERSHPSILCIIPLYVACDACAIYKRVTKDVIHCGCCKLLPMTGYDAFHGILQMTDFMPERPYMTRRFINQFGHQETVNEVFVANGKQLRPNRNGNLYLQVELSDSTGSIGARMWNANEPLYKSFENGDYIRVEGTTQIFQGAVQMIAHTAAQGRSVEVNPEDFTPQPAVDVDKLFARLGRNAPQHERSGPA